MNWIRIGAFFTPIVCVYFGMNELEHEGIVQGRAKIQAQWDKESRDRTEAEKVAVLARLKNNERIADQQKIGKQKIWKDVINETNAANAHRIGLRLSAASICSGLASAVEATGPGRDNAPLAGTVVLPSEIDRDRQDMMEEADLVVASCRATQADITTIGSECL